MPGIAEYYSGKALLVTGGTGFVGKVLLESILRKLPDVGKVYVLIRPRTGADGSLRTAARRLQEEVLDSSAFQHLRSLHGPRFDSFVGRRLEAVAGDLASERLGMDPETYEALAERTDVVINSGALAVFDAPLDRALETNAVGPRRVLEFARRSAKPPFVAHVSTCYVNRLAGAVFETPLDPRERPREDGAREPLDVDEEVRAIRERVERIRYREAGLPLRRMGYRVRAALSARGNAGGGGTGPGTGEAPDRVRELREEWIRRRLVEEGTEWSQRRGWNDTYTFTKALGEQLFLRHRDEVPGLILRPSIIESSLWTPARGWMEGFRMLEPLIVSFARGHLFEFPGNPESVVDVVPADIVANALLAAIPWAHAGEEVRVFHVAAGMDRPLKLKEFRDYLVEYFERAPLARGTNQETRLPRVTFPEPGPFLRRLRYRYLLPLRLLERAASLLAVTPWGRRTHSRLRSRRGAVERLYRYALIYAPYAKSQARFLTFRLRRVWNSLSPQERARFPFDIRDLDWRWYMHEVHIPGIKRHLLGIGPGDAGTGSAVEGPAPAIEGSAPAAERAEALATETTPAGAGEKAVVHGGEETAAGEGEEGTAYEGDETATRGRRETATRECEEAVGTGEAGAAAGEWAVAAAPPLRKPTAGGDLPAPGGDSPFRTDGRVRATASRSPAGPSTDSGPGATAADATPLWTKAEKVLSLTEHLDPGEVRRWITPAYKKALRSACCRLIRAICEHHLNLECAGREHIPERGPFIVVSNHTSHVDTGALLAALGPLATRVHPAAATDYWFRNPLLGWLLHWTLGAIPFDRHSQNISRALGLPAEILRNGHSLIFYPEGGRSTTGELRPFRSAIGLLALASAAPVLPVYIEGAYEALPKGEPFLKRHPVRVTFGPPTPIEPYLDRLDRESVSELARRLAEDVQAAVESLRGPRAG